MGPRLRKIINDALSVCTWPSLIVFLFLLAAIFAILMSILGVNMSLSGREVMMLSMTTVDVPVVSLPVEKSDEEVMEVEPEEWDTVQMRVTAYCPCQECCGRFADGVTACNHRIREGDVFVAADKKYRFRTEVIVPGYNKGEPVKVLDRGRVIKGNRLDVFFNSHRTAKKWGVKYLDVKVKRG
jgi:3D (Asp-Asp-Asp) domain-containing protein